MYDEVESFLGYFFLHVVYFSPDDSPFFLPKENYQIDYLIVTVYFL